MKSSFWWVYFEELILMSLFWRAYFEELPLMSLFWRVYFSEFIFSGFFSVLNWILYDLDVELFFRFMLNTHFKIFSYLLLFTAALEFEIQTNNDSWLIHDLQICQNFKMEVWPYEKMQRLKDFKDKARDTWQPGHIIQLEYLNRRLCAALWLEQRALCDTDDTHTNCTYKQSKSQHGSVLHSLILELKIN